MTAFETNANRDPIMKSPQTPGITIIEGVACFAAATALRHAGDYLRAVLITPSSVSEPIIAVKVEGGADPLFVQLQTLEDEIALRLKSEQPKKVLRSLARRYHPDTNHDPAATLCMARVTELLVARSLTPLLSGDSQHQDQVA